jgi:hypothetical protein
MMNPWLVTWEHVLGRADQTIKKPIAAILPKRTPKKQIRVIMQLLYAGHIADFDAPASVNLFPLVHLAKRRAMNNVFRMGIFPVFYCGTKPMLKAQHVFNLRLSTDETGVQMLRWEENFYPTLDPTKDVGEQIDALLPFKRRRMIYSSRTNTITREVDTRGER